MRRVKYGKITGKQVDAYAFPARHTTPINHMKATTLFLALAVGLAVLPACTNMESLDSVSSANIGKASRVVPATVVSARSVTVQATDTDKNLGTGVGAAVGAGAGQLLGGGKGRAAATVGFALLGALVGREVGAQAGKKPAQQLTVKLDGSKKHYSVTQPVYREVGVIPVGAHGLLYISDSDSKFLPDGH